MEDTFNNCQPCKDGPSNCQPKKIENVGEEFIDWAEKYWAFRRIVSKGMDSERRFEDESCPYPTYRKHFVDKINELVGVFINNAAMESNK